MTDSVLFKEIRSLPSLHPNPLTNKAFSRLVSFCCTHDISSISLRQEDIETLQCLSSQAEEYMEIYWAKRILAADNPSLELENFWYRTNYTELINLELSYLTSIKNNIRHILFVGGGPLPLSAIELARRNDIVCTVLERNNVYAQLATDLIKTLGFERKVTIIPIDAQEYKDYQKYDVVYIAALVGTKDTKPDHIFYTYDRLQKGALLIARHGYGARTLIYPPLDIGTRKDITPVIEIHPETSILNSFSVLQKE